MGTLELRILRCKNKPWNKICALSCGKCFVPLPPASPPSPPARRALEFAGDGEIVFDKPSHTYTVRGKKVPISVTKLGTQAVPPEHRFDGRKVLAAGAKHLEEKRK